MPNRDLTLAEVAELRRFTQRQLREFILRHKIPVFRTGKKITFNDRALAALEEALLCRSKSSAAPTPAPSPSPAPSSYRTGRGSAFERALRLTTDDSPKKKPGRSKPGSSATPGT